MAEKRGKFGVRKFSAEISARGKFDAGKFRSENRLKDYPVFDYVVLR